MTNINELRQRIAYTFGESEDIKSEGMTESNVKRLKGDPERAHWDELFTTNIPKSRVQSHGETPPSHFGDNIPLNMDYDERRNLRGLGETSDLGQSVKRKRKHRKQIGEQGQTDEGTVEDFSDRINDILGQNEITETEKMFTIKVDQIKKNKWAKLKTRLARLYES